MHAPPLSIRSRCSLRDQGFTLIEMLVSLAILAMMSVMLLDGLRSVSAFIVRTDRQDQSDDTIANTQRMLRDRIEQLRSVVNANSAVAIVDATGEEASFTFLAPPLARAEPDSLWRYRIMATATGELMLYWVNSLDDRYDFGERDTRGWQVLTLARNIESMQVTYFGAYGRRVGRGWQSSWIQRPQAPDLVRIRISFRKGDRRVWPDLIVRPRATENTACRIDLLSGRCGPSS